MASRAQSISFPISSCLGGREDDFAITPERVSLLRVGFLIIREALYTSMIDLEPLSE